MEISQTRRRPSPVIVKAGMGALAAFYSFCLLDTGIETLQQAATSAVERHMGDDEQASVLYQSVAAADITGNDGEYVSEIGAASVVLLGAASVYGLSRMAPAISRAVEQ